MDLSIAAFQVGHVSPGLRLVHEQNGRKICIDKPSCKDEARIGQKNKITRRWAKRGSRPSAPSDQRTASTYIFGAICPERGVDFFLGC